MYKKCLIITILTSLISLLNANFFSERNFYIDGGGGVSSYGYPPTGVGFGSNLGFSLNKKNFITFNFDYHYIDGFEERESNIREISKTSCLGLGVIYYPFNYFQMGLSSGVHLAGVIHLEKNHLEELVKISDNRYSSFILSFSIAIDLLGKNRKHSLLMGMKGHIGGILMENYFIRYRYINEISKRPPREPREDRQLLFARNNLSIAINRAIENSSTNLHTNARIAIVDVTAADMNLRDFIRGELEHRLSQRNFRLIDRARLEMIFEEQQLQLGWEFNEHTAVSIGRLSGAEFILTARVDGDGEFRRLRITIINVEKGEIVGTASERI